MLSRSAARKLLTIFIVLSFVIESQARTPLDDWNRVRALAPGSELFVKTADGTKYKGALSCATDRELILYAYQHGVFRRDRYRVVLPRADVLEVRMLARELSGLVGAGIGAGAGAALGAGLGSATARNHEFRSLSAVTLAFLGSAVGMAIGRATAFIKGARIYVAQPAISSAQTPE